MTAWQSKASTLKRLRNRVIALAAVAVLIAGSVAWSGLKASAPLPGGAPVSMTDSARFVFVPSSVTPQVTVIDGKLKRIAARIDVPGVPNHAVVSDAAEVIASSISGRDALQMVSLSAPSSQSEVKLPITPDALVLSPDGYLLAIGDSKREAIAIVSLQQRKVLFSLAGFHDARDLAFSFDGSQLYVSDGRRPELAVLDIVQQKVVGRVALQNDGKLRPPDGPAGASALTRTPDGRFGFVSITNSDSVAVVDLRTLKFVKSIAVGRSPLRAYGTADGRLMLVPNDGDRSISIIDTTTLDVTATLTGFKDVIAIATGWFESRAFVLSSSERRVAVLDLMTFSRTGDIDLPSFPGGGVVDSAGQNLYVALTETDQTAVIDARTSGLTTLIDGAGRRPWGTLMARSNNYCH